MSQNAPSPPNAQEALDLSDQTSPQLVAPANDEFQPIYNIVRHSKSFRGQRVTLPKKIFYAIKLLNLLKELKFSLI